MYNSSAAWGDYDNDGDLDILLTGLASGDVPLSRIYRNEGAPAGWTFTQIDAGLADLFLGSAAWGDYDNDGDLDILLTGTSTMYPAETSTSRLYRNEGASAGWTFTEVGAGLLDVMWGSAAWGDYDVDGDLDFLLTGGVVPTYTPEFRLYRNQGAPAGWGFTTQQDWLLGVHSGSMVWGDYDDDGDLDILAAGSSNIGYNAWIYANEENPQGWPFVFRDVGFPSVAFASMAWGDYDNDGDLDILFTAYDTGEGASMSRIYRNEGAAGNWAFTDVGAGLADVAAGSVAWGDYDNDGDLDALITGADSDYNPISRLYRNEAGVPDLALAKRVTPLQAMPGDAVTYTLSFSRQGPACTPVVTGVTLIDQVPPGVTVTAIVSSGAAITRTGVGPEYGWQVQDLAPGQGGVITLSCVLDPDLPTILLTNTATITFAGVDVLPANNHAGAALHVYAWQVISTTPTPNSVGVPFASAVGATFDGDLDPATATPAGFTVHGMQSGVAPGSLAYDPAGRTLTFTPAQPFHAGEIVRVSATGALLRTDGQSLLPNQWQYQAGDTAPRCVSGFTLLAAGVHGVEDGSLAWGDYDGDGDLDLLQTGYYTGGNILYRNDAGTFTPVSAGLPTVWSGAGIWGDYDGDGDLDVLMTGCSGTSPCGTPYTRLYRNNGGTFSAVSAGLPGLGHSSAAWGDYDNDGDLDLLLAGRTGAAEIVTRLYRNDGGTFVDSGADLAGIHYGAVAWGDYDGDGDLDIALSGHNTGSPDWGKVSAIYRNDPAGNQDRQFTEIGSRLPGAAYSALDWGDYDGDGDLDLLFAGCISAGSCSSGISRIYRNDGAAFAEVDAGLPGVYQSSANWGDYDNDGDLDILVAGQTSAGRIVRVYRNDAGTFSDISAGLTGVTLSAVAWGDYDGDGDLDLVLSGRTATNARVTRLYRNDDCLLPDLAIDKHVTPAAPAAPSAAITYTLVFSNVPGLNAANATGVVITDSLPVSLTATSVVSSGVPITPAGSGHPYIWQVHDLAPGEGGVLTITAILSQPLAAGTAITNAASIGCDEAERLSANNRSAVTVTIQDVPPVAAGDVITTGEDTPVTIGVLDNDREPNGQDLVVVHVDAPAHGSAVISGTSHVIYTPTLNFYGNNAFAYTAGDGTLTDTARVSVTVTSVNDPPVLAPIGNQAIDEGLTLILTATATDVDLPANVLTYTLDAGAPAGASIGPAAGIFTWTPTEAQGPGVYSVTVRVTDDGVPPLDDYETITITVAEVNQAPLLASVEGKSVDEGTALSFTVTVTDADLPPNTLAYALDVGAPAGSSIDPTTGVFTWTPGEAQGPGVYSVTVRVVDDGIPPLDDAETITITVAEVNMPPVTADDRYRTTEDTPLRVAAPGVLGNDGDDDLPPNALAASLASTPNTGELGLGVDGSLIYTPAANSAGVVTFTYVVSDGLDVSPPARVTITVTPVCDYAVYVEPSTVTHTAHAGTSVTYTVRLTNAGECDDVFDTAVDAVWVTGVPPIVGPLPPGVASSVTITVTVPANAGAGDQDAALLTLVSQHNNDVVATTLLTTTAAAAPPMRVYLPLLVRGAQWGHHSRSGARPVPWLQ